MEEFPGNSRTPKPVTRVEISSPAQPDEERVYEPVITGSVTRKKKGLGRKFMETFFAKDTDSLGTYVLHEVLLPTLRDLFINAVTSSAERAIYGDKAPPARSSTYRGASTSGRTHVNYNGPSRPAPPTRRPQTQPSSLDIGLLVFDAQVDAEMVAEKLFDELREYECVTVAALYGFMRQVSTPMDYRFGWENLDSMHIIRQRNGGWLLDLPQPINLRQ